MAIGPSKEQDSLFYFESEVSSMPFFSVRNRFLQATDDAYRRACARRLAQLVENDRYARSWLEDFTGGARALVTDSESLVLLLAPYNTNASRQEISTLYSLFASYTRKVDSKKLIAIAQMGSIFSKWQDHLLPAQRFEIAERLGRIVLLNQKELFDTPDITASMREATRKLMGVAY
ncbi:MAG: hypothetical protein FD167_3113 [bacterium]|nr:MAG: hypothetical protein FD167_3113 [bacterium]TSC90420.1 MAG: hypothetical protein G01um10145_92 [Microgenomates group bacterium Gr01-1014_5]